MNNRITYLDTLRCLACFLVVFTHSAMPTDDLSLGPYYGLISIISAPSSELFLALSGALLLPVHQSSRDFYTRRFSKLIYPLLLWSLGGLLFYNLNGTYTLNETYTKLLTLPFKPCIGVYWFMYVLIGLYLYAPILSKWLLGASKKEIQFYLMLWAITMTLPLCNYFKPGLMDLSGSYYECFATFGGFMGYMILGCYCVKYPIIIQSKLKASFFFFISQMVVFLLAFVMKIEFDNYTLFFDNLAIMSAIQVFLIIHFIININDLLRPIQQYLTKLTPYLFGVYLVHIYVVRDFVWLFFENRRFNPILETICVAVISIALSLFITYFISKLPKSKYIIGI